MPRKGKIVTGFRCAGLIEARERNGWSRKDLAEKLGVGESTIMFWEYGYSRPFKKYRMRMAELFDIEDYAGEGIEEYLDAFLELVPVAG